MRIKCCRYLFYNNIKYPKKGSINAKDRRKNEKGNIATVLKKGSEWSKVRSGNVTDM